MFGIRSDVVASSLVVMVGLAVGQAHGQNLVSNGDFSANAAQFTNFPGYLGDGLGPDNPASIPNWQTSGSNGAGTGINGTLAPGTQSPFAPANNIPSYLFMQGDQTATQAIITPTAGDICILSFQAAARNAYGNAGLAAWGDNSQSAGIGIGSLNQTSFQSYSLIFQGTGGSQTIQFQSSGSGDHTSDLTNVAVVDVGGPAAFWTGSASGNLGGPDLNWGGGTAAFSTALTAANGTLYFGDNSISSLQVSNTALNVIPGAVTSGTLQFINNYLNYSLTSSDGTGITGSAAIEQSGIATTTLAGTNTYTGGTVINAGLLDIGSAAALGTGPVAVNGGQLLLDQTSGTLANNLTLAGNPAGPYGSGALVFHGSQAVTLSGTVTLAGNTQIGNYTAGTTVTFANTVSGSGGLVAAGPGTLALRASNTYTGGTTIQAGTLNFSAGGLSTGPVVFSGGTLQYASGNVQDVSAQIQNSTAAITVDTNGNNVPFISGLSSSNVGGLTKLGAGMLVLGGANSYSGATTIAGGTLQMATVNPPPTLLNGSFQSPNIGADNYVYYSSLSVSQTQSFVWTSSGNSLNTGTNQGGALVNSSTAWGYTMPYPSGSQAFSLQDNSTLDQSLYFLPGTYMLAWSQASRAGQVNPYWFQLNGTNVGSEYAIGNTSWTSTSATFAIYTAGTYTIGFSGTTTPPGDESVGLDDMLLSAVAPQLPASLRSTSPLAPPGTLTAAPRPSARFPGPPAGWCSTAGP